MLTFLLLIIQLTFMGDPVFASEPIEESKRFNNIDFKFLLEGNTIKIHGFFKVPGEQQCVQNTSFDFSHKKAYTKGPTDLLLHEQGEGWYEVYFIIEKYFMAKVKALYHYSLDKDDHKINFELLSNVVNIHQFNVVDKSNGFISFLPDKNGVNIEYELVYKLKPTMMTKMLFKVQKKESMQFLSDYKSYLERHCQ